VTETLHIDRLGHRGDGVARAGDAEIYVPYTLEGETVSIERAGNRARLVEIVEASPDRVEPVCRHFGHCGGCQVQHLATPAYLEWKRRLVADALAARGIDHPVEPVRSTARAGRRRAEFAAVGTAKGTAFGFHERFSDHIVDLDTCPLLVLRLADALPRLRTFAGGFVTRRQARLQVLDTASGLDVNVVLPPKTRLDRKAERRLLAAALDAGLARLSVDGETLIETAPPLVEAGRARIKPPPGGFLQASAEAEGVLAGLVTEAVGGADRVADLFCGAGTFALRLAETAKVRAVEADRSALAALKEAANHASGLKSLDVQARDLFRSPLRPEELTGFDAVVFDPPRAGARAQAEELARSKVETVVAVSCNPATLARDLASLREGGFEIRRITPVDQFVFSHHVEVVAVLSR